MNPTTIVDVHSVTLTKELYYGAPLYRLDNYAKMGGAVMLEGSFTTVAVVEGLIGEVFTDEQKRALAEKLLAEVNAKAVPVVAAPAPKPAPQRIYGNLTPLCKTVFQHMKRCGSISAREAMSDHGVTSASLARRICDLEAEGFKIKRTRKEHPLTGKAYTRYELAD